MELELGWYLVLEDEDNGIVAVYNGSRVGEIKAPKGLKVEDGSFLRFGEELARQYGWSVEPQLEMPHCLELV